MSVFWKEDWDRARERLVKWWNCEGPALCVTAPRNTPWEEISKPEPPGSLERRWLDPEYRARSAEYTLSRTYHGAEAFPYFDTHLGPGNLATFLGSEPEFHEGTVWYTPCWKDIESPPPLCFNPNDRRFLEQLAILETGVRIARGRFLVGMPDLIENIDIVASLRGNEELMMDMVEQPEAVSRRVEEVTPVFFEAFHRFFEVIRDPWGGNAFSCFRIWGPGKTAKVQCDASAMFSPAMFKRFVVPALGEQCRQLDYSLFHLDGVQCIPHLDHLLEIEALNGIQWTPQAGRPGGGNPVWFDLYRRILAAGKCLQCTGVQYDEVFPLLDAIGSEGVFVMTGAPNEEMARRLEERVEAYR